MNQFLTFAAGALSLTLVSAAAPQPERAANAAESSLLVIDHRGYPDGEYLLRLTKTGDGVTLEPLVLNVVGLDGKPINGTPKPDPNPDPPEGTLLDQVRDNFGADQDRFESQLTGLIAALDLSRSEGMSQQMLNVFVQGKMEIAFGDYAHHWKPWSTWFIQNAVRKTTLEEYKAWVEEAAETLVQHCGFRELQ